MKFLAVLSLVFVFAVSAFAGNYGVQVQQQIVPQAAPVCQSCQPQAQILQAPAVQYVPHVQQQILQAPVQYQAVQQQQHVIQQQVIQRQFVPQAYSQVIQQQPVVIRQVVQQRAFAPVVHSPVINQRAFIGRQPLIGAGRSVFIGGGLFRPRVLVNF